MRRNPLRLVAILAAALALAAVSPLVMPAAATHGDDCSFPVTRTDATGTDVTLPSQPSRIVVTQPSAAQTIWEIGGRERVVGVPAESASYLDGADARPDVTTQQGFAQQANVERVVDQSPDLVLAPNITSPEKIDALRQAGLTVFHFSEAKSLPAIYDKTHLTGRLIGECEGADEAVSAMQDRVSEVDTSVTGLARPRAVYLAGGQFAPGDETFIGDLVVRAGAENIAADDFSGYQKISDEVIARDDPQWFVATRTANVPDESPYTETTAGQTGQTLLVDDNLTSQPAPRVVIPLAQMARTLHPGAGVDAPGETVTGPTPVSGTARPRDPDGDGLYENVDGSRGQGEPNVLDVIALLEALDDSAVTNHGAAFNFDGDPNDAVNILDVVELLEQV
jgi:iron complex transport system substrate-binding protein